MILTKEVEIKLNNKHLKHYIDKGYCVKDKKTIIVKIDDLPKKSHVKILVECENCKTRNLIQFNTYNEPYVCKSCNNIKVSKTKKERYNDENYVNLKKMLQTKEKLYGDKYYTNRIKFKNTCVEKYGVENVFQLKFVKTKIFNNRKLYLIENYPKLNFINILPNKYTLKCDKGHLYEINQNLFYQRNKSETILCTICNPINSYMKSGLEKQLLDYIKSIYYGEVLENIYIGGKEIDIYIPHMRLAFEFNGLFLHNDNIKNLNYHKLKSDICDMKNIRLFHIWEDDWLNKNNIVKQIIKYQFNNKLINSNFIIKKIKDYQKIHNFYINHSIHIQDINYTNNIFFSILMNNEIISIISLKYEKNIKIDFFLCDFNYDKKYYFKEMIRYIKNNFIFDNIIINVSRNYPEYDVFESCEFNIKSILKPIKYFISNKKRFLEEKTNLTLHDAGLIEYFYSNVKS